MPQAPPKGNTTSFTESPVGAPTWRDLAFAAALSVGLTVAWLAVLPHASHATGDALDYVAMAQNPRAPGHSPFAYRVLTPFLAQAIGGPYHYLAAYRLLTGASLAATGPAVYLICRRLGAAHLPALAGVAGLLCLPGWLFNLYQPYLIDPMAMSLTGWAITATVYGWFAVLPLILTATGLARETVVGFALPIYMWLCQRWLDWRAATRVFLVLCPAVLTTWAVQQRPTAAGWPTTHTLITAGLHIVYTYRISTDPGWWLLYAFMGSLGVWWVFGLAGWRHGGRLWWLLVPVFAQFAVGGDWSRFALYAFPVVIPAGVIAIWRHPRRPVLLALAGLQSMAVFADLAADGRLLLNQEQPSMWINLGLACAAAAVLWWPRWATVRPWSTSRRWATFRPWAAGQRPTVPARLTAVAGPAGPTGPAADPAVSPGRPGPPR